MKRKTFHRHTENCNSVHHVSYMMLMEIKLDKVGSTFQKKEGKDK